MQEPAGPEATPPAIKTARWWHHLLALTFAVLGGFLGALGSVFNEVRAGGFILLPLVAAPIIEEALKPSGIYIVLAKWPHALRGQLYTAVMTAASGLCFGVIEALAYVFVYIDDPPDWLVTYRFTLPLLMHTVCSFIMGMGINRGMLDWAAAGGTFPRRSRILYFTAVGIHAAFNAVAVTMALTGVFPDVD